MITIFFVLVGLGVGVAATENPMGACLGGTVGYLLGALFKTREKVETLVAQVASLEFATRGLRRGLSEAMKRDRGQSDQAVLPSEETPSPEQKSATELETSAVAPTQHDLPVDARAPTRATTDSCPAAAESPTTIAGDADDRVRATIRDGARANQSASRPRIEAGGGHQARSGPTPSGQDALARGIEQLRGFIFGGNTVARVGAVITIFAVGLLGKYAIDRKYFPVEVRLIVATLVGIALIAIGWRLRDRRPGFATTMQGGGTGAVYITVFFAMKIYQFVPPEVGFPIMVALVAFSGALAVLQDALGLAVLGAVGGFLAPILASSDEGRHVILFSYYLVLNGGILAIGYFRAWRVLNLLGFFFTFGVGTAWGALRYRPENFATTEPFLIAFFLFYVAIAVLYAYRQAPRLKGFVDATLVFGTPLLAFGLQSALVHDFELGLAWSALAMGLFYVGLGLLLIGRAPHNMRGMVEAFLAIGIAFGTMAVPLALDNHHLTAATWGLEGAALLWFGIRQERMLPRVSGILLQLAAGVAFAVRGLTTVSDLPIGNSRFVGCVILAFSSLFIAWYVQRNREKVHELEVLCGHGLLLWGLMWWLGGATIEIDAHVDNQLAFNATLFLFASTALGLELVGRKLRWPAARVPPLALPGVAAAFLTASVWELDHPLEGGGWIVWPATLSTVYFLLWRRRESASPGAVEWLHGLTLWLATALVTLELAWAAEKVIGDRNAWSQAMFGLGPAIIVALVVRATRNSRWPIGHHREAYLRIGAGPLVAFGVAWLLYANLTEPGLAWPMFHLPLLNPIDISLAAIIVAMLTWYGALRTRVSSRPDEDSRSLFRWLIGICVFLSLTGAVVRTVHFWADVRFDFDALFGSVALQTALSIFWTALALTAMVISTRRGFRTVWIVSASVLGVVVVKLFLVDLSTLSAGPRIISFFGVGLLLLAIGYFSPVPPELPGAGEGASEEDGEDSLDVDVPPARATDDGEIS